jgi:hypothetical protein
MVSQHPMDAKRNAASGNSEVDMRVSIATRNLGGFVKGTVVVALVSTLLMGVLPSALHAAGAKCPQATVLKAGVSILPIGSAGITITFSPALPRACTSEKYVVVLTQLNDAGYSPVVDCTYLNVLNETPNSFQVQHKTCKDGVPQNVTTPLTFGWVAVGTKPQ